MHTPFLSISALSISLHSLPLVIMGEKNSFRALSGKGLSKSQGTRNIDYNALEDDEKVKKDHWSQKATPTGLLKRDHWSNQATLNLPAFDDNLDASEKVDNNDWSDQFNRYFDYNALEDDNSYASKKVKTNHDWSGQSNRNFDHTASDFWGPTKGKLPTILEDESFASEDPLVTGNGQQDYPQQQERYGYP